MPFQEPPPPNPPAQVQTQPAKKKLTKRPTVKQQSSGTNSPNVSTGDNSPVTIGAPPARNPRFKEKVDHVTMLFGPTMTWPVDMLRKTHAKPLALGGVVPFEVYMEGDTLFVDVNVSALAPGSPTISIKHNEFSQPPPGWDRNFDDQALEFVDEHQRALLQLVFNGESNVSVRGIFKAGNFLIASNENGIVINPTSGTFALPRTIFKYPSGLHLRERIEQK
jgi:hypothetical protein